MFIHYQSQSTVKRKQKLLKDLIEYFGREYKDIICSYIDQSNDYFEEGHAYHDIFTSLKSQISSQIPNSGQHLSTEYQRSSINQSSSLYPKQTPIDSQSKSKPSAPPQHYLSQFQKFNLQKSEFESRSESQKFSSFLSRPSLIMQSKEDELKALEAIKQREEQSKQLDQSRGREKFLAAKGTREFQFQQIREKYEIRKKLRDEDKKYANIVDKRLRYADRVVQDARERDIESKKLYKQALLNQLSEKNQEKVLVRSIEDRMKYFMTPEPQSPPSPSSQYSRCYSPSSPSKSNLRFLAQYGNLVMSKNK